MTRAGMTREAIGDAVRVVLATAFDRPVGPGEEVKRLDEPTWDSVKHIDILFMLEEELGITFDESEIPALDSVGAITDRAAVHLGVR